MSAAQAPLAQTELRALGCAVVVFVSAVFIALSVLFPPLGVVGILTCGIWLLIRHAKAHGTPQGEAEADTPTVSSLLESHRWEEALVELSTLEGQALSPAVSGMKGQVLYQLKRFAEAVVELQRGTGSETERFMTADSLRHLGEYRRSIELLTEPFVDADIAIKSVVLRGANHLELGESEIAIAVLKTAPLRKRLLDENLKQVHWLLAAAYKQAGRKRDAIRHLHRIYAVDPGFMGVSDLMRELDTKDAAI